MNIDANLSRRRRDKPRVVEEMFDRIAPRYDLLNRLLTFRMDVGWRTDRGDARCDSRPARVCSISRAAPATSAASSTRAATTRSALDFSAGMLRARAHDAPLVRADALRLPFADASFDGDHVRLRLAQLRRRSRPCSRSAPACCVPADGSRCSTSPNHEHGDARAARALVPQGRAVRRRTVSDSRRTATCPPRPRTSRRSRPCSRCSATPASSTLSTRTLGFGAAQLITGTRA